MRLPAVDVVCDRFGNVVADFEQNGDDYFVRSLRHGLIDIALTHAEVRILQCVRLHAPRHRADWTEVLHAVIRRSGGRAIDAAGDR
jgi:hypothetical protein